MIIYFFYRFYITKDFIERLVGFFFYLWNNIMKTIHFIDVKHKYKQIYNIMIVSGKSI